MKFLARTSLAIALSVVAAPAIAAPVTYVFSAAVTSVTGSATAGGFFTGQSLTGSFSYDTDEPDFYPGDPTWGAYSTTGFSLTFAGGYTVTFAAPGGFDISDNFTYGGPVFDEIFAGAGVTGASVGGYAPVSANLRLEDSTASAFATDAMTALLPGISAFDFTIGGLGFGEPVGLGYAITGNVFYELTSFSAASAVPGPGALALLALGLVGMGAARRRGIQIYTA